MGKGSFLSIEVVRDADFCVFFLFFLSAVV